MSAVTVGPTGPAAAAPVAITPGQCGAGADPCGKPARLYPGGWRCDDHSRRTNRHNARRNVLCRGCGGILDPAAATGCDGDPAAFARHPGCEPVRAIPIRAERPRTTAS